MRKWLLAIPVGLALFGCAGVTESLVEATTGMEMETREDGSMVITNPDGTVSTINQGANAKVPDGFPLPKPPGTPELESVSNLDGEMGPTTVVSYRLDIPAQEAADFYAEVLKKQGTFDGQDKQSQFGMAIRSVKGKINGKNTVITITDVPGVGPTLTLLVMD